MKTASDYFANTSGVLFIACFLFIGLALVAAMGPLWLFWTLVLFTLGLALLTLVLWAFTALFEGASHWTHDHWSKTHRGAH